MLAPALVGLTLSDIFAELLSIFPLVLPVVVLILSLQKGIEFVGYLLRGG